MKGLSEHYDLGGLWTELESEGWARMRAAALLRWGRGVPRRFFSLFLVFAQCCLCPSALSSLSSLQHPGTGQDGDGHWG